MIGLSYYKYVTKLVKKIKLNTTRILRMLVVFNIIFFTRFVTLTNLIKTRYLEEFPVIYTQQVNVVALPVIVSKYSTLSRISHAAL